MVTSSVTDRESLTLELGRRHPTFFTRLMRRRYQTAELHWKIGTALKQVEAGEIDRLMIRMPPRHGKSTIASLAFPAWYLGRNPDKRIIAASYGDNLARGFGRGARNLIRQPAYQDLFPNMSVATDSSAANSWDIAEHDGGYIGTTIGGSITGMGAHVLLIDDPVKGREEAESETIREKTWDWYTNDAYTRLEEGGAIVVIMTPWHEDDLSGRLIAEQVNGGDIWTVLDLPALDANEQALWPEKYDAEALKRIRRTIGAYAFEALYQQHPSPPGGGVFKRDWFNRRYCVCGEGMCRYFPDAKPLPSEFARFRLIQTVDIGGKQGVGHDPSAIATWASDGISYFVLDYWSSQAEYADVKPKFAAGWHEWRNFRGARDHMLHVEDATWAQPLISDLKRETGVLVKAVPALGSKWVRADAAAPVFESGRVLLPCHGVWVDGWLHEHLAFPNAAHDEAVDTSSMAVAELRTVGVTLPRYTSTGAPIAAVMR